MSGIARSYRSLIARAGFDPSPEFQSAAPAG
jgi:hypothetical protein